MSDPAPVGDAERSIEIGDDFAIRPMQPEQLAYFRELIQGDGDVVDDDEAMQLLRWARQGCERTGLEPVVPMVAISMIS